MADAGFVLEIAASMPGGEQTAEDLNALTERLMGAGKGAEHFQQALKIASADLESAKAASAAASATLAEARTRYAELEKAALSASKAEEKAALSGVVPPQVAANARAAQAAVDSFAVTLDRLERESKQAADAEEHLAGRLSNVKKLGAHVDKTFAQNAESIGKVQGALGTMGGPLSALGQRVLGPVKGFQELSGVMGSSKAAMLLVSVGAAAAVAAIVALTAAVVASTLAFAAWGVSLADSARNAGLATQAAEVMHPELAALSGTISSISDRTGMHADELREYAGNLLEAGVASDSVGKSLERLALAQTALGEGGDYLALLKTLDTAQKAADKASEAGGAVPKKIARDLDEARRAVEEFEERADKLAPIVAQQMRGLGAQSEKLKKNFGETFGGLDIEPVLRGLERLVALFDQSTVAGETMKFLFESVFQPMIDQADKAATVIEAFAIGFLIGLTKLYIALKPIIKSISELFGFDSTALTDTLTSAKNAGEIVAYVFAGVAAAFGAVFAAIGVVLAPIIAVTSAFVSLVGVIYDVNVAILGAFVSAFDGVKSFLGGLPAWLTQMGGDLMMGLVNGITGGAANVVSAMVSSVGGALDAAKKTLGIASPSKEMAKVGDDTTAGFVQSVDAGAEEAQDSLANMVEPPAPAGAPGGAAVASGGAGGAPAAGGGRPAVNGNTFNFYGVKDAQDAIARLEEAFTRIIEGDADSAAGAPA